jgi:hypothetical protein
MGCGESVSMPSKGDEKYFISKNRKFSFDKKRSFRIFAGSNR